MSADPPWLDEAERMVKSGLALDATPRQIARVVGKFAARQPRPITDAMVDVSSRSICWTIERICENCEQSGSCQGEPAQIFVQAARAALEAAEKAREDLQRYLAAATDAKMGE